MEELSEALPVVARTLVLAFLAESLVEYFFGVPWDHIQKLFPYRWALMYVSAGAGVFLSFFYQLDLIALMGGDAVTPVGTLLTGFVIGRGANFVHQFISQFIPKPIGV